MSHYPLSSFVLELTMWMFFKVQGLKLCSKFNWIMLLTCKASFHGPSNYFGNATLSKPNMVCGLKNLFQTLYAYFSNSPKRHLELNNGEDELKRAKILFKMPTFLQFLLDIIMWCHFNGMLIMESYAYWIICTLNFF
jgi:hypothetical protein